MSRSTKKLILHALLYFKEEARKRTDRTFNPEDWLAITNEEFEHFRATRVWQLIGSGSAGGDRGATTAAGSVTSIQVQAFESSHRRDSKVYRKYNGYLKTYFRTIRQWNAQAKVDDVGRIFDPKGVVPDRATEDFRLWERQQAYVMSVLTQAITGGQALTILRRHTLEGDAHQVLVDVHDYYTDKGNISTLRAEFHRDLAVLRMNRTYSGGPTKFLSDFQTMYLDLEEATQRQAEDHEKVGQLTAAVSDFAPFETIMSQLDLVAQTTNEEMKYADAIQALVRRTEVLKVCGDRKVNSLDIKDNQRTRNDSRSTGRKKENNKDRGDYIPYAQYQAMSFEEKREHYEKRKARINSTNTARSTSGGT